MNGEWIQDLDLTNIFEYDQKVLGVYGTGAYEDDKWGLKLGLAFGKYRSENLLVNTNKTNDQNLHQSFSKCAYFL